MISALVPGNNLYILYTKDTPVLKIGEVVSKTEPVPTYNSFGANYNDTKFNLVVKIDNEQVEFKNISGIANTMNDPSSGIFISETPEAMITEITNKSTISRKHIDSTPYHENALIAYDKMLKELNPRYAKEQKMDEDITNLKNRQDAMDDKLDKILKAVMSKN